jgi:hypothetical protein
MSGPGAHGTRGAHDAGGSPSTTSISGASENRGSG